jgi:hypothetical protein
MTITLNAKKIFGYGALLITALLVITFVRWTFEGRKSVLVINNDPVPVKPPEVNIQDGVVFLTIDYCKNRDAHGATEVYLVGEQYGAKIPIAWPEDKTPKGCAVLSAVPVNIPAQTPTDTYHVVFEIRYATNPIKESYTIFRSRSFKVVNEALKPGSAKPIP